MNPNPQRCEEVLKVLRRIIRAIELHSRSLSLKYGLTGPQLLVLKEIGSSPHVSVSQLARQVSLSSATVTDILDRMEKRGLVQRTRSHSDRRRADVTITEKGQQTLSTAPTLLQEQFVSRFSEIKDWEQTLILSSLQRLASLMELEETDSSPMLVSGELNETEDTPSALSPGV